MNEFIRSLYNVKIQKNISTPEVKKNNWGIKNTGNLFGEVDEDYYKPIKTKSAFKGNYIEYESKGVKDKNLSPKEYLDIIEPYLGDMINDHKTRREWKIQLTTQINFISSKDSEETGTMHTKSSNIEIMMSSETNDIIKKLCESRLQNYKKKLEELMRGSKFVPYSIDLLFYHLQTIGLNRGGSYIDSPEWLKNKKATINPKNYDGNCFQYALTVVLNHQNIKSNPERPTKINRFINQHNRKEINFQSHKNDWKNFKSNNE